MYDITYIPQKVRLLLLLVTVIMHAFSVGSVTTNEMDGVYVGRNCEMIYNRTIK